jgi:ADP-heptose:LPS heptosyltransferase/SAM-dependent methyltransferase
MHFLVSNPDTIGDLVLRQPMYRALLDAGHELTLIVRASVESMVGLVAPGAKVVVLPREVYGGVAENWSAFAGVVEACRAAAPDVLLIAAYQWTEFEERLTAELRQTQAGLVVVGMSGRLYHGDPFAGRSPVSALKLDRVAEVDPGLHEADKNAALAAMLGHPVATVDPLISPPQPAIDAAQQILQERGFSAGEFFLACVTGTAHVPIKAWPADRWGAVLRTWQERYGRKFLFIGLPEERSIVEQVQAAMGEPAGAATAVWMEPGGSIATLAALASLSQGYVGHDTGPMHIAAAVGKPVIAVFGGGHKLRFTPRVTPSVTLAVRVPCAGCGWACSFDKAHCVHAMTVDQVLAAVEDLETGRVVDREIRLHPLAPELNDHMISFAADLARQRARDAADITQQLHRQSDQLQAAAQREAVLDAAVAPLRTQAADLTEKLRVRDETLAALRSDFERMRTNHQAAIGQARKESGALEEQVAVLQARVSELESQTVVSRPLWRRLNWRGWLVEWIVGSRTYAAPPGPPPLPSITLVTVVSTHDDDAAVGRTIDSVLAEDYPGLQYVLASDDPDRAMLQRYRDRGCAIVATSGEPFAAIAEAFAGSEADLIAWLNVGQSYEPGALQRIGEYFRQHRRAMAATFEQTIETESGWRFTESRPRLEVGTLRDPAGHWAGAHVIFRRQQYQLLGPLNPERKSAAGWDLLVRFARRYGIRRGRGHSICQFAAATSEVNLVELAIARAMFEPRFSTAGRVRVTLLALAHRAMDRLRRMVRAQNRRNWSWPSVRVPSATNAAVHTESQAAPLSPISRRAPDRLLFSAPDTTTGDATIHCVYYDSIGDVAITCPPIHGAALEELYAQQGRMADGAVVPPADPSRSPFRQYRAGPMWVRWLTTLPSPFWRLSRQRPGEDSVFRRAMRLLGSSMREHDADYRVLVVGAFDGELLDELKKLTSWQVAGIETNESAVLSARTRGHRIWACSPQDAFMTLPDGEVYDLLLIPSMLEHWTDPAMVLRRLTRLLKPRGKIILRAPNLDSRLLELFGPTWWHWQLPYHRTLLGRSGLRALARMCDLRVARLRTATDAYTASASVQLNRLGLAGTVPLGAEFPPDVAARGSRLAGWARMLWDRWGRGDEIWAVLEMI